MLEISSPLMKKYAEKIDADYIAITERKYQSLHGFNTHYLDVLQVYDLCKGYERVLYLDADILVNPVAPDIFDIADPSKVAVVENIEGWEESKERMQHIMGKIEWKRPYWEEGVLVIPNKYIDYYNIANYKIEHLKEIDKKIVDVDQALLNYVFERDKVPLQYLDDKWNGIENKIYKVGINKEMAYFLHMTCLTTYRDAWMRYYADMLQGKELPPKPLGPNNTMGDVSQLKKTLKDKYEGLFIDFIGHNITNESTVLDIGARWGPGEAPIALAMAVLARKGKVYAIDPLINNSLKLLANRENVVYLRAFVSNTEDKIIKVKWNDICGGMAQNRAPEGQRGEIEVPAVSLDSLGLDKVDIVKIDVEGNEWRVIQGGKELIERNKMPIALEIGKPDISKEDLKDMLSYLRNIGYRIWSTEENRFIDDIPVNWLTHALCVQKEEQLPSKLQGEWR